MSPLTPSLLITDDDLALRETLREVFVPRGFQTLLAANGEEALRILSDHPVHVLLLDMHMPRLNGLDTILRVRQLHGRLPWILMSACPDDLLCHRAREAEPSEVLAKPISFAAVTDAVRRALRDAYGWELEGRS